MKRQLKEPLALGLQGFFRLFGSTLEKGIHNVSSSIAISNATGGRSLGLLLRVAIHGHRGD